MNTGSMAPISRRSPCKAWSREESAALQAAVQQYLTTHKPLDWDAIVAAAVPGRSVQSVISHYYYSRERAAATRPRYSKPGAVPAPTVRRPCLRCRAPFESADRKRNWICGSCKRSHGENPLA
jgi:Myb-like DNA-binding domain